MYYHNQIYGQFINVRRGVLIKPGYSVNYALPLFMVHIKVNVPNPKLA